MFLLVIIRDYPKKTVSGHVSVPNFTRVDPMIHPLSHKCHVTVS